MKTFEYMRGVYYASSEYSIVDHMNDAGKDGWEVIQIVDNQDNNPVINSDGSFTFSFDNNNSKIIYYKREIVPFKEDG